MNYRGCFETRSDCHILDVDVALCSAANEVWSMDFVFDRIASGRSLKILGIVDDGTHEAVAVHPEHAIGGEHRVRVLQRICASRGYPRIIRTDNAKEFTGKAMLTWGYEHGVKLRLIEPGKPNQNAYIESFNGRFRDECLNEHWFLNLRHARILINGWRREYNEERPKQGLIAALWCRCIRAANIPWPHTAPQVRAVFTREAAAPYSN